MRKILYAALAASALMPVAANAQSAGEVRRSYHEVQRSEAEVRRERAELRRDIRRGDWSEAREDREELREDRRELGEDRRELREDWRDYRDSHRYGHGQRFAPGYYASRNVIYNPRRFGLYNPPRYQSWIRHRGDALLIDRRSGYVVKVYRNYFR